MGVLKGIFARDVRVYEYHNLVLIFQHQFGVVAEKPRLPENLFVMVRSGVVGNLHVAVAAGQVTIDQIHPLNPAPGDEIKIELQIFFRHVLKAYGVDQQVDSATNVGQLPWDQEYDTSIGIDGFAGQEQNLDRVIKARRCSQNDGKR